MTEPQGIEGNMRTVSMAIAMLAWVTVVAVIAISPQTSEPVASNMTIAAYALMIVGAAAAALAGYLTRDTGLPSSDTGFRAFEFLFPAALLVAVPRLNLSWPWKFYVSVVTLALGTVVVSVPIGKRLFKRTKRDI
jgi:peptidoglycan/LPS O-acetylase OafA/YrhL